MHTRGDLAARHSLSQQEQLLVRYYMKESIFLKSDGDWQVSVGFWKYDFDVF